MAPGAVVASTGGDGTALCVAQDVCHAGPRFGGCQLFWDLKFPFESKVKNGYAEV